MTTKVEKTITVNVPISTAYNQWTQFEEFPQFMGGVQQVEQLDDQRLRWVAEIAGVRREWYADILEQRADEKVAWAATEGATNAGAVYFISAGAGQTQVTLELEYDPEGLVEKAGDALNIIERQAQADMERFKTFIESRGTESGGWRGDVGAPAVGTPGVEMTTSEGDSGKAGVSPKVVAAGAAVAAAGVAAAAAAKSGSDEDSTERVSPPPAPTENLGTTPAVEVTDTPPATTGTAPLTATESTSDTGDVPGSGIGGGTATGSDTGERIGDTARLAADPDADDGRTAGPADQGADEMVLGDGNDDVTKVVAFEDRNAAGGTDLSKDPDFNRDQ